MHVLVVEKRLRRSQFQKVLGLTAKPHQQCRNLWFALHDGIARLSHRIILRVQIEDGFPAMKDHMFVKRKTFGFSALLLTALMSGPANAAGVDGQGGFMSGLLHPILGFDHLLAMVAVGLLSVQIGGRAVLTVPAAFVAFLIGGGALGLAGILLPAVEGIIALSVLVLGFVIAMQARLPMIVAMAAVGVFAIFHGHAHGTEVPSLDTPLGYVAGFAIASAVLHLAGVGLGALAGRPQLRALIGAGIAGIGLHMVLLTYSIV